MYKSSPFTVIFRFFFPVIMLVGVGSGIIMSWKEGTADSIAFTKAMIPVTIWISLFLVQMPFKLRYIVANDSGIIIKEFGKEKAIDYNNIHWVTKFHFICPWAITINYYDKDSGEDKKIAFMPNRKYQRFFANDIMTDFIKRKIAEENKSYSKESQPSQIKNFIILFLLSLPFMLLSFYFMNGAIGLF